MTEIITLLAMDIGDRRVGLAATNTIARLPRTLTTLQRDEAFWERLQKVVDDEKIQRIVVGLPRGLNGQETEQTRRTRDFGETLKRKLGLPIIFQDEALTSWQAERELGSGQKTYTKGQIDALAAVYILEDYLSQEYGKVVGDEF